MNLLGRFLIADEVYIAFAGERGRTDLFKVSKKIKRSMLAVINKWNKINNQPVIEEPKPEPKPEAEKTEEETVEAEESTENTESDKPVESVDVQENTTEENNNSATE